MSSKNTELKYNCHATAPGGGAERTDESDAMRRWHWCRRRSLRHRAAVAQRQPASATVRRRFTAPIYNVMTETLLVACIHINRGALQNRTELTSDTHDAGDLDEYCHLSSNNDEGDNISDVIDATLSTIRTLSQQCVVFSSFLQYSCDRQMSPLSTGSMRQHHARDRLVKESHPTDSLIQPTVPPFLTISILQLTD